jgi:hypothetical protein
MIRFILGVLAGLIIFYLVWIGIDYLNFYFFPIAIKPTNSDEDLQQLINHFPIHKQIILASGYIIGSLLAGFISSSITKIGHLIAAIILGTMVVGMAILIIVVIPQPIWMSIVGVITPIPSAIIGSKIAQKP